MLPLERWLFTPCYVIVPLVVLALLVARRAYGRYDRFWRIAVATCAALSGLLVYQFHSISLYSQRGESNPDSGWISPFTVLMVVAFELGILFPAVPVLVALALLPPREWRGRTKLAVLVGVMLFVSVSVYFIAEKNLAYVADFEQTKQREIKERRDYYLQLRRP